MCGNIIYLCQFSEIGVSMEEKQPDYFPSQPRAILTYLLCFNVFLTLMFPISIASGSWNLQQWFDLDGEISVPTWHSSSQLLVSGLFILAAIKFRCKEVSPKRGFYLLVGLGLVFLSADEASMIHERLTPLSEKYASFVPLFRGNNGAWITIYAVVLLVIIASQAKNIILMSRSYRESLLVFSLGLAILVTGAVLIEITMYYSLFSSGIMQVALEEFLEMTGGSIILVSAVMFLNRHVEVKKVVRRDRVRDRSVSRLPI